MDRGLVGRCYEGTLLNHIIVRDVIIARGLVARMYREWVFRILSSMRSC